MKDNNKSHFSRQTPENPGRNSDPAEKAAEEMLNVAPGIRPFTPYKAAELCLCAVAVVAGLLYLYTPLLSLAILLPLYCLLLLAITVIRIADYRHSKTKGFAMWLPALCWGLLTLAVTLATVVYFTGRAG